LALLVVSNVLTLPTTAKAASLQVPIVFWDSSPTAPGDIQMLFGDGLTGCNTVGIERLSDGPIGLPGAHEFVQRPLTYVRSAYDDQRCLEFALPKSNTSGIYRVTVSGENGVDQTWINRPEIEWAQGDGSSALSPGGVVRIFGRSLSFVGKSPSVYLLGANKSYLLKAMQASPFAVSALLPEDVSPGSYSLYLHSGCGGNAGWSLPVDVLVEPESNDLAFAAKFDVRSFGAKGDGVTDDSAPIMQALKAAGAEGGVVYFSPGVYMVDRSLAIPQHVTLVGKSATSTMIKWFDPPQLTNPLIFAYSDFTLRNLTFSARTFDSCAIGNNSTVYPAGRMRIIDCRLLFDPYYSPNGVTEEMGTVPSDDAKFKNQVYTVFLTGTNVEISGTEIYGSGQVIKLSQVRGAWIHNNKLYCGNNGWYSIDCCSHVVFEDNTIDATDRTSGSGGIACYGSPFSEDIYFARNLIDHFHQNSSEGMTTDAPGGAYYGTIDAVAGNVMTLTAPAKTGRDSWAGGGVFILSGAGEGQYRLVTNIDGTNVVIDKPWTVEPDSTSMISITKLQRNYIFENNTFDDVGVAIQMYGSSVNEVAYRNTSSGTSGYVNSGRNYYGIQPSWFVEWLDNTLGSNSAGKIPATLGVTVVHPLSPPATMNLCTVVTGNTLLGDSQVALTVAELTGQPDNFPYIVDALVQDNQIAHNNRAIHIGKGVANPMLVNNGTANVVDDRLSN
jgi:hypothetical protein